MLTLPASLPKHKSVWKRGSSPQVSQGMGEARVSPLKLFQDTPGPRCPHLANKILIRRTFMWARGRSKRSIAVTF